jgi:hypothetical protein
MIFASGQKGSESVRGRYLSQGWKVAVDRGPTSFGLEDARLRLRALTAESSGREVGP